jgi:hypothetical protein
MFYDQSLFTSFDGDGFVSCQLLRLWGWRNELPWWPARRISLFPTFVSKEGQTQLPAVCGLYCGYCADGMLGFTPLINGELSASVPDSKAMAMKIWRRVIAASQPVFTGVSTARRRDPVCDPSYKTMHARVR